MFSEGDTLKIYDGNNISAPMIGQEICGRDIPENIVSTGNQMFIRFQSDLSIQKSGFKLLAEAVGNNE